MMVDGRLMEVSRYSWSTRPVRLTLLLRGICTVIDTRRRSFGRLLPQLRHVLGGKMRSLAAESCGDVIGDRRDLVVGISVTERRHRYRAFRRMPLGTGDHDLGDIGRAGIVDRPGAGKRGQGRNQTFTAPAVATDAGAFEHHLAARVRRAALLVGSGCWW